MDSIPPVSSTQQNYGGAFNGPLLRAGELLDTASQDPTPDNIETAVNYINESVCGEFHDSQSLIDFFSTLTDVVGYPISTDRDELGPTQVLFSAFANMFSSAAYHKVPLLPGDLFHCVMENFSDIYNNTGTLHPNLELTTSETKAYLTALDSLNNAMQRQYPADPTWISDPINAAYNMIKNG
ncbi:MAG: hypothetical protein MRY21_02290 [Simkaniaceae bacterium]|nr:hypothetical protein [Simkaniaceae bacterium]